MQNRSKTSKESFGSIKLRFCYGNKRSKSGMGCIEKTSLDLSSTGTLSEITIKSFYLMERWKCETTQLLQHSKVSAKSIIK